MKKYCNIKYGTKAARRNYSKINYDFELPNLIKTQMDSFDLFLKKEFKSL